MTAEKNPDANKEEISNMNLFPTTKEPISEKLQLMKYAVENIKKNK